MKSLPAESLQELDRFVAAYESAEHRGDAAELAAFLPPADHPLRREVVRELVRVDLERSWTRGQRRLLEEYRPIAPEVFEDSETLGDIAFEEYRQRCEAHEDPNPEEYRNRYRISTAGWPRPVRPRPSAQGLPRPRLSAQGESRPTLARLSAQGESRRPLPPAPTGPTSPPSDAS